MDDNMTLYKRVKLPIMKLLSKQYSGGKFSMKSAVKPFLFYVEQGARQYCKTYGGQ
jgi:hypothetical protein